MFPDLIRKPVLASIQWGEKNLSARAKNAIWGALVALALPRMAFMLLYRYFAQRLPKAMEGGEELFVFAGLLGLVFLFLWLGSGILATILLVQVCLGALLGYVLPPALLAQGVRVMNFGKSKARLLKQD